MKLHKNRFLASSLFISLSLLPSAHAATGTWSGGVGDTWDDSATNWNFDPAQTDPWNSTNGENNDAIFNLASLAAPVSGTVYTNGITFNTGGTINAGGIINLAGTSPFLSAASGSSIIKSILSGTSGFTKMGPGSITINASTANTLTGTIQINAGQLVVQPGADVASFANTATLAMTGGSMSFLGASTAASPRSQTFAGTTISSGHSAISVNSNALTSVTDSLASLTLGTVSRSSGATVNLAYTGQQTTVGRRTIQSSSWTAGGTILDSGVAYATYATGGSSATSPRSGNDWAASDASGNVILATYTNISDAMPSGNANVNANTALASGATITSLRFSDAAVRTVTISSGNLTTGGILVSSAVGARTSTITGGTLRSAATLADKDLVIINNNTSGGLVISSTIANAEAGSTGLTKSGAGRLVVTSDSNSYTGATRINEGTLRIGNNSTTGALSTSSAIVNNGILELSRTVELTQGTHFSNSITGTGRLDVINSTIAALNTSNSFSGGVSIPGNGVVKVSHGSALGTGTLSIGSGSGADLTARLELSNDISVANAISLNGRNTSTTDGIHNTSGNNTLSGTITLFAGGGTGYIASEGGLLTLGTTGSTAVTVGITGRTLVLRGAGNGNVAGAIQNSGSNTIAVTKDGAGTWTLSDTNNYTGTTTISDGTLVVNGNISTSTTIVQANGTLAGIGTVGGVTVGANGTLAIGSSPGTMTFAGDLGLSADSISNFEINDFTLGNFDLAIAATAGTQTVGFNGGTLNLLFQSGFNTTGSVTIFDFDAYSGTGFTSVVSTGLASGYTASFDANNGMVTVVPEPRAALLGGIGMLALLRRRRA